MKTDMKTLNEKTKLVKRLNPSKVQNFFEKYPNVKSTMEKFVQKNEDLNKGYMDFAIWVTHNNDYMGAKQKEVYVENVGVIYPWVYDWSGIKGFKEAYQYLFDLNQTKKYNNVVV
jgi:hypothetical protein